MSRYTARFQCAEPGCREMSYREYDRSADRNADYARERKHPFKCIRHKRPDEHLNPDNLTTTSTLTAQKVPSRSREGEYLSGLFWKEGDRSGSGFVYGPGFNAYASDFPEGTQLIVTTRIVLPAPTETKGEA